MKLASLVLGSLMAALAAPSIAAARSVCQESIGFAGPGTMKIALCGDPLDSPAAIATFSLSGAPASTPVLVFAGLVNAPTPILGGTLVPVPPSVTVAIMSDASGAFSAPVAGLTTAAVPVFAQAVTPSAPHAFSNALRIVFGDPGPLYSQDFAVANGSPWPAPWQPIGGMVTLADVQNGRARLEGFTGQVARMSLQGVSASNVEVTYTIQYQSFHAQGIGFYVRQNGGCLQNTPLHGQGYAIYLEGGFIFQGSFGLWREVDGVETKFAETIDPIPGGVQDGVDYRVRYRVEQVNATTTRLRAKLWRADVTEPAAWTIDATDSTPILQGTTGGFAADIYNYSGMGRIQLDDLFVTKIG